MNRKGQGLTILLVFVGIIVALAMYQGLDPFMGQATGTATLTNSTFTSPAAGSTIDLTGQELLSTPIVSNRTGQAVVPASNYTIEERISTVDGLKRITYTSRAGPMAGQAVNISYSYGREGYIEDAGGRGIANLIPLFAALAVALIALSAIYKDKIMDAIGG